MAEDEKLPRVTQCRFCGSPMTGGYVYCKECGHFNDWRRFFAASTPVLGLLVALVSVVGINASNVKDMIAPPRASFLVGAAFNAETMALDLVATNIGGAVGYLDQTVHCASQGDPGAVLAFRSAVPATVQPGHQTTVPFPTISTFFGNFLAALEDGQFTPSYGPDGYGFTPLDPDLGGPWLCAVKGYDAEGDVTVVTSGEVLSLYLRNGRVQGGF